MKTIKNIIVAAILICCNSISYAQMDNLSPSEELQVRKGLMKNIPYIFEGVAIKQQTFLRGGMPTATVIQITKIFKGSAEIKLGTIKVITWQGGWVGNSFADVEDNGSGLGKGGKYIIFGYPVKASSFDDTLPPADNSLGLRLGGLILFDYNTARWDMSDLAPTSIEELYAFFKENGLTVQEQVAEPKK